MPKDYYKILGVEKSASKEDIKKAFRKLAHEHHPDKNKGEDAKFKEINEAYTVLSDDQKRAQYDRFGSAGHGAGFNPNQQGFGGFDFSGFAQQYQSQNGQAFEFDLGDIFGEFFGGGRRPKKGANITVDIQLSFKESIFGAEKEVSVNKEKLAITIPPGIENGQGLRVQGKGEDGPGGRGDLIVRVWVEEHDDFRKEGYNLVMELDLLLTTALLGKTIEIETLDGKIDLKIPAGTTHNEILRIKQKGVPYEIPGKVFGTGGRRGDLLIVTKVEMPKKLSKQAQKLIEELRKEGL
ncbi:MAG: DnaJ C-terminal domain-containing protein [Patescibacteria group bacterium]